MNFDAAKFILDRSERHELRDHAFGDMEITWTKLGIEVGSGYLGSNRIEVIVEDTVFLGQHARKLIGCGTLAAVERNDTTGPDEFVEGQTMTGLTREGVREEITRRNIFDAG